MTVRTLLLHAGTHHTGTTSIQYLLDGSAALLGQHGIAAIRDHPSNHINPLNCMAIANAFIRPSLQTPARICNLCASRWQDRTVLAHFAEQLAQPAIHTFILSSPTLAYLRDESELNCLLEFLESQQVAVRPLVYFRENQSWRRRRLYQISRNKIMAKLVGKAGFELLDDWYFDVARIRSFFRALSNEATFVEYEVESQRHGGSVIGSFVELAGLPASLALADIRKNVSISK